MNNDNKIVRAITGVTCVMMLGKALAMLRNILQARVYGAGADMDLFTQASNYTISIFTTVAYALCVAAIPMLSQGLMKRREEGFRTADRLISNTVTLSLILMAGLLALTGAGGLETLLGMEDQTGLFRFSASALILCLPIVVLTYLLLALFQSMGHLTLQGSLGLLYNLALCAVLVIFGAKLPLRSFVAVTAGCWLLQLAMNFPFMAKEGYRPRLSVDLRDRQYWDYVRTALATVFNSALFLLCYLVNTRFAAAGPEGTVSAFFYAGRLYEPLSNTLIYSVSIVLFPKFSQQYQQMSSAEYRQNVVHMLKNTLLLALPVSLLFTAFGTPVVRVLFEGGSFTYADSLLCGSAFSMFTLGMAGFFMLDILNKAYYAMGKTLTPLVTSVSVLAFCGVCNLLCARFAPNSPALLAAGTSLAFLLGGAGLYWYFAKGDRSVEMPKKQLFFGTLWSLVIGVAAYLAYDLWIARLDLGKIPLMVLCLAVGAVLMVLYLILMGPMVPTKEILSKLGRKKGER